jgi:hypothetical protein
VYEYDAAISFLASDEPFAREIADALTPLTVFVYSKAQEQIAGKEGVEAFRVVFRERSRLAVVLFRPGYGETPWTRVEATAIRDNCLEHGWNRLFVLRLTRDAPLPKWIPDSHIYFDPQTFGLSDLVGAVKARCAELGANLRPPTPVERARAIALREAYDRETKGLLDRSPKPFHDAATELFAALEHRCVEMRKETSWDISHGLGRNGDYVFYARGLTLQLLPREVYLERASEGHFLVRIFRGRLLTQEQLQKWRISDELVELTRFELKLYRVPDLGWCWRWGRDIQTHQAAADALLDAFLRACSAEVQ